MNAGAHQYEDKLLEFAYGELPAPEAKAVEAHLKSCARCSEALGSIRGVRSAMSQLPAAPAPEAGLESLLAYAEQAARRHAAGPAPAGGGWRKWLAPLAGVAALVVVGVVAYQADKELPEITPTKAAKEVGVLPERMARSEQTYGQAEPAPPLAAEETWAPAQAAAAPPVNAKDDEVDAVGDLRRGLTAAKRSERQKAYRTDNALNTLQAPEAKQKLAKRKAAAKPSFGLDDGVGRDTGRAPADQERAQAPSKGSLALGGFSTKQSTSAGEGFGLSSGVGTPPSSMPAAPRPSAPSSSVAETRAAERAETGSSYDREDQSKQLAVELESLLSRARKAQASRDYQNEILLAQEVMKRGATGYQQMEALRMLCEAFLDLGDEARATPYCEVLMKRFPSSGAAKLVRNRMTRASDKKSIQRKVELPSEKDQAPAQAAPEEVEGKGHQAVPAY
ncbi:MAG: anti-sigma factor family protein [Myxococcota bacterium]